jgi:tRNA-dihydrouridine synthase 3
MLLLPASALDGKMILAPLTRGGNLPFRRLCADLGCEAAMGEMVFARYLIAGDRIEKARMRRADNEPLFAVQIATNDVDEGRAAVAMAADSGADWVDLNCGCPIHEATRRNLGSALLRKPDQLASLVGGIAADSPLPLSVKVRIAAEGRSVNVGEVVEKLIGAGAAAVTIHGRTAEARYSKSADWQIIGQCVDETRAAGSTVPIVGNGDILTHYEARMRMAASGVNAVMVGRGALTKPWLFDEFTKGATWEPSAAERVEIYRRLACYMKVPPPPPTRLPPPCARALSSPLAAAAPRKHPVSTP